MMDDPQSLKKMMPWLIQVEIEEQKVIESPFERAALEFDWIIPKLIRLHSNILSAAL